jgi:hypothetical protein
MPKDIELHELRRLIDEGAQLVGVLPIEFPRSGAGGGNASVEQRQCAGQRGGRDREVGGSQTRLAREEPLGCVRRGHDTSRVPPRAAAGIAPADDPPQLNGEGELRPAGRFARAPAPVGL